MTEYFKLRFTIINRQIKAFGLPSWAGYIGTALAFLIGSLWLFSRTEYAPYFYVLLAWLVIAPLSENQRNFFLKNCFGQITYRRIRLLENAIVSLPFLMILWVNNAYLHSIVLILGSLYGAVSAINWPFASRTLPTPFSKNPFEFAVMFRKTWLLVLAILIVLGISVSVNNFNLGVATIGMMACIGLAAYSDVEPVYYTWIFAKTPTQFLIYKVKIAFLHFIYLALPVCVVLLFVWPANALPTLLVLGASFLILITVVLGKYVNYPNQMGIPQAILLGVGIAVFPLLPLVTCFFYVQAQKQLLSALTQP